MRNPDGEMVRSRVSKQQVVIPLLKNLALALLKESLASLVSKTQVIPAQRLWLWPWLWLCSKTLALAVLKDSLWPRSTCDVAKSFYGLGNQCMDDLIGQR